MSALWAALLVTGLAIVIAVRELHRAATFDEGVYLNSLRALQRGAVLGRDVFASQPPGYYLLLRMDGFLFPDSLTGLRLGFAALGLLGCLSIFALGRLYAGVLGGTLAAVLFIGAPPTILVTSSISPDLAAVSVSLVGMALLAHVWQGRIRRALAYLASFAGGAALFAATIIKLDAVFAILAVCVLAVIVRPPARLLLTALGGLAVASVCLLAPFAGVARQLWKSGVTLHMNARHASNLAHFRGSGGVRANTAHIASAFTLKSNPVFWLMLIGCLALIVHAARGGDRRVLWLLLWPLVVLGFLLWQTPLFAQHVVLLAGAAAIPAGVGLAYAAGDVPRHGRLAAGIVVAVVLAAYADGAVRPVQPDPPAVKEAVNKLRAVSSPRGYVLATDQPIVAFLADRPVPPRLVDTSWVRLLTGSITRLRIIALARSDHVAAVLAGPRLLSSVAMRRNLRRLFSRRLRIDSNSTLFFGEKQTSR